MLPKVIVIGIDAASWDAILPHISKLPIFRKFIEEGCWGCLESCMPPLTCPAWKCYSTGKTPGKLGVYWWVDVDWDNQRFVFHNSKSFRDKEIWDYLSEHGYKVGIINMPMTFPPKKVNGFCIAGMPGEDSDKYTYPQSFKKELIERFGYKVHPKNIVYVDMYGKSEKYKALDEIFKLIETRFKVAKHYVDYLDFLHITLFYSDFIHHHFGDDNEIIYQLYKKIDDELRNFIKKLNLEKTYIFLISDHGQCVYEYIFRMNEWLHTKRYLFKKKHKYVLPFQDFINVENIGKFLKILKLDFILKHVPSNVRKLLKSIIPRKSGFEFFDIVNIVNFKNTIVLQLDYVIYINKKTFKNEKEYLRFRNRLITELKTLRNPFNGEPLFEKILSKDETYQITKGNPPDIFFIPNQKINVYCGISSNLKKKNSIWMETRKFGRWVSTHTLYGIFGVIGPDIKKGYNINPKIYDLAPTILYIFDLPIPNDVDGRVLKEVFEENSQFARKEIKYEDSLRIRTKGAINKLKLGGKYKNSKN